MNTVQAENNKTLLLDFLIIAVIWAGSLVIVNPLGDFPLNDDWASARTVKHLLETGNYVPSPWMAMSLVTNILWGALFCLPAGFSFIALRLSTLTIALIGLMGVYWLGKELKLPRSFRITAALTLGFNPMYYTLSSTFMTDVPFTALLTLSALFFVRCLKDNSNRDLYAGISFALAATFSRQLGIAVPLAFAIVYFFRFGFSYRHVLRGLSPLIICVVALISFEHWLFVNGALSQNYLNKSSELLSMWKDLRNLLLFESVNSYVALVYLGLFLFPSLALTIPAIWSIHNRQNLNIWLAIVIVGGMTVTYYQYYGVDPLLPMIGKLLGGAGMGPLTLRDTFILDVYPLPWLPKLFWTIVTWLGVFGAILIFAALIFFAKQMSADLRFGKTSLETASSLFLLLCTISYLFPLFAHSMGDRYFLPIIPLLTIAIMNIFPKERVAYERLFRPLGLASLLAFSLFSVSATRDYLTWNRVRWEALNDLTQVEKIDSRDIDGGFEFNGWNFYDAYYLEDPDKSWWWVQGDTYLITFSRVSGYSVAKQYIYSHWLPPYTGRILVLKKSESEVVSTNEEN
jgi:4-amino-4-deoxy-L-arabinose transferase-like glycosyltransferase